MALGLPTVTDLRGLIQKSYNNVRYSLYPNGDAPNSGYDVYLLWWQSNTIGRDSIRVGIDDDYSLVQDKVYQFGFNTQAVSDATNPLDHNGEQVGDTGFWLGMCNTLVSTLSPTRKILLVPVAKGGTGFETGDWNKGDVSYESAKLSHNAAMAQGTGINIVKGIIAIGGETDADTGAVAAAKLKHNLIACRADMISDFNGLTYDTPFILGTIKPDKPNGSIINNQLDSFAGTDEAITLVDLTDLSWFDSDHYTASSIYTAGVRFAGAL